MFDEYKLIQKISLYNPYSDKNRLMKALLFAKNAHTSQIRASGDPYFSHPLAVANILSELKLDDDSIITGILHDTVEDTMVSNAVIESEFGETVAKLVEGVTKLDKVQYQPESIRQAENFRKMLVAMSEDIRVLLVKICDRLHNMRTIDNFTSNEKKERIAQETLDLYAPLTERIGIHTVKDELQDISFSVLYPEVRDSISQRLKYLYDKTAEQNIIDKITSTLSKSLKSNNVECSIKGRIKKPYSIWKKMKSKNVSFEQLSDVVAFRIIVNDLPLCYKALGILHSEYPAILGKFKDYISTSKHNGYQSLHTIIVGPHQKTIEIQIRTEEMHQVAEYGIAAHWSYKQEGSNKKVNTNWIDDLLSIMEENTSPAELLRSTKIDAYNDFVFCFTPKGKLIELPVGSTPVDFAYAIHSDVGDHCINSKVNGITVSLDTVLKNGDQVSIFTSQNSYPSESWEDFVITNKAKSHISKYYKEIKKSENFEQGKELVLECLEEKDIKPSKEIDSLLLKTFSQKHIEKLYIKVGERETIFRDNILKCLPDQKSKYKINRLRIVKNIFDIGKKQKDHEYKHDGGIFENDLIQNIPNNTKIKFSTCCTAILKDKIIGIFYNHNEAMDIHREKCFNIEKYKGSIVKLKWITKPITKRTFSCKIKLIIKNTVGSIANITNVISSKKINIHNIEVLNSTDSYFEFSLEIWVTGIKQLQELKADLHSCKDITHIERIFNNEKNTTRS